MIQVDLFAQPTDHPPSLVLVAAAAAPGELGALAGSRVVVPLGEGAAAAPGLGLHLADLLARLELGAPPPHGLAAVHAPVPALVLRHEVVAVARAASVLRDQLVSESRSELFSVLTGQACV